MPVVSEKSGNQLIIIGNGMASNRLLEELGTQHPFDQILIFSNEAVAHYNRIMLSPLLAGETTLTQITPHDEDWYQQRRARILLNTAVENIDIQTKKLQSSGGEHYNFSQLVIATGSQSFIPNLSGADSTNVSGFRDIRDVDQLLTRLPELKQATVIGGGLLGVEAAVGLKTQGVDVTLLHRNPVLMNRQLDAEGSILLTQALQQRGVDVQTGATDIELISDQQQVSAVSYQHNNTRINIDTQAVIFATGIQPTIGIAENNAILCDKGILVDERMRTSADSIYALGECCQFEQFTYGLVAPIWDQAKVLAAELLQTNVSRTNTQETPVYREQQHLTKLKVSGLDVHSVGEFNALDGDDVLTLRDDHQGIYKKVILRNNTLAGALCIGEVADSQWYFELMRNQTDIRSIRDVLLFGKDFCEPQVA